MEDSSAERDTVNGGTDMGKVELRGGDTDTGGLIIGNGCRPLIRLAGDEGVDGETPLALLSLRPRYCATLS